MLSKVDFSPPFKPARIAAFPFRRQNNTDLLTKAGKVSMESRNFAGQLQHIFTFFVFFKEK